MLETYNKMLVDTNKAFNLTAHKTIEASWKFNVLDSLLFNNEISKNFKQGVNVIDLGSGSGSPAVPLKISFPQMKLTMIDSTQKKVKFLQAVSDELELGARAVHARIEDFAKQNKETFDIVTARAVAPLDDLVKLAFPLLRRGGVLIAFKGKNYQDEVAKAKHTLGRQKGKIIEVIEKNLDDETKRVLLIIRKNG